MMDLKRKHHEPSLYFIWTFVAHVCRFNFRAERPACGHAPRASAPRLDRSCNSGGEAWRAH